LHFDDRLTDKQMDSSDALSRSRCRELRLNHVLGRSQPNSLRHQFTISIFDVLNNFIKNLLNLTVKSIDLLSKM